MSQRHRVNQIGIKPCGPFLQTNLVKQRCLLIKEGHSLIVDISPDRHAFGANRRARLDLVLAALLNFCHGNLRYFYCSDPASKAYFSSEAHISSCQYCHQCHWVSSLVKPSLTMPGP